MRSCRFCSVKRPTPTPWGQTRPVKNSEEFAFVEERKEPLTDAAHVRNAIARFDQVEGVTDDGRDRAWRRIVDAARRFDVEVSEDDWRQLFGSGRAPKD
jgi:hypothetical protein